MSTPPLRPAVALESTVIAHGLPHPENERAALRLEATVRAAGAVPRTIGLIGGEPVVGLSEAQIRRLATAEGVRKVSLRDLPVAVAEGLDGATTVAATLHLAHRAGLGVFATGGIGGVHRTTGPHPAWDVSADLDALARYPLVVVCAGPKAILDLGATREALETRGVPVVGYGCDRLPAFYSRDSDHPVDIRCDTPEAVAAVVRARDRLGLPGALLVAVPPPETEALLPDEIEPVIAQTVEEAAALGLRSAEVTPFLLRRLGERTEGRTLGVNLALLEQNARVAARIAVAMAG
ncbi:MAG: pseudouridine-5'-phosphate glycosidase [Rubricoccaceae bacterium]|nr:pseudouridine-5'-phosphate glycosidase [Rubricoccaceae bacterium]